jgi:hypothetical protein
MALHRYVSLGFSLRLEVKSDLYTSLVAPSGTLSRLAAAAAAAAPSGSVTAAPAGASASRFFPPSAAATTAVLLPLAAAAAVPTAAPAAAAAVPTAAPAAAPAAAAALAAFLFFFFSRSAWGARGWRQCVCVHCAGWVQGGRACWGRRPALAGLAGAAPRRAPASPAASRPSDPQPTARPSSSASPSSPLGLPSHLQLGQQLLLEHLQLLLWRVERQQVLARPALAQQLRDRGGHLLERALRDNVPRGLVHHEPAGLGRRARWARWPGGRAGRRHGGSLLGPAGVAGWREPPGTPARKQRRQLQLRGTGAATRGSRPPEAPVELEAGDGADKVCLVAHRVAHVLVGHLQEVWVGQGVGVGLLGDEQG